MWIRIQLAKILRFQILLHKIMRIRIRNPVHCSNVDNDISVMYAIQSGIYFHRHL